MSSVQGLTYDDLVSLLMKGASGLYIIEASVRLLDRHGYWLRRVDFLGFVEIFGEPFNSAGIHWAKAIAALDEGRLKADYEAANILRIAASLCTFYQISFRDVMEQISRENIKHVAEAFMYADGFLNSVADPRP